MAFAVDDAFWGLLGLQCQAVPENAGVQLIVIQLNTRIRGRYGNGSMVFRKIKLLLPGLLRQEQFGFRVRFSENQQFLVSALQIDKIAGILCIKGCCF